MIEAMKQWLEAFEEIALAGMSGTGQESDEAITEWHARQAWKFIGIAARQLDPLRQAIAEAEKLTTTRNVWTGKVTYKCNLCGRDDFRSEHSAKFHTCQASEETEQNEQDRWLDIQLPDTSPPQRQPLTQEFGITDMIDVGNYSLQLMFKSRKHADEFKAAHGIKE